MINKYCRFFIAAIMAILLVACGGAPVKKSPSSASYKPKKTTIISIKHINPTVGRQELMLNGMSLIGTPYRYGGTDKNGGFDCSGMVQHIYKTALGVNLPRTARDIAASGKPIKKNNLQVGDLVFFNTTGQQFSHVGIYIGDNRFVHSPNSRQYIKVDSLNSKYYASRFTAARTFF